MTWVLKRSPPSIELKWLGEYCPPSLKATAGEMRVDPSCREEIVWLFYLSCAPLLEGHQQWRESIDSLQTTCPKRV